MDRDPDLMTLRAGSTRRIPAARCVCLRVQATLRVAAVALSAATLGACASVTGGATGGAEVEENLQAASPANIASLTSVVQRNPDDPQAYNMRGSVFGQAGQSQEALADFN